ncbi:hypothetical protein DFH08DRAFT_867644 [Mycena albidolilacea]|uniref:Reverse transcriptase zinc-binding domain-containing protein n=1 Tax=Mycena albidolilacea TaxID=1033008 RepID=A0AAD7A0Q4_9AGAR|nr:hypothetical protein DFH08DRAFT_867644 [Mycena albidolilacea]
MRTGHAGLNAYLARFGAVDSGLCQHCRESETVTHYLLTCWRFTAQRDVLRRALYAGKCQPLIKKTLLGKHKNKLLLLTYVAATGRFPRYTPAPS